MNELIMNWSSEAVYEGQLRAADIVRNHTLNNDSNSQEIPVLLFVDTAFCNLGENIEGPELNSKSKYNEGEADIVAIIYQELKSYGILDENIGNKSD
jgi:superfamily I DNA and/or RNA helicase